MMHGREKSDLVVVAVKPTNKAEQSAAELVEPRMGTKGNAGPAKHAPGTGPGKRVTGAFDAYGKLRSKRRRKSSRRSSTISMLPCYAQPSLL